MARSSSPDIKRPFRTDYAGAWCGNCSTRESAIRAAIAHVLTDGFTSRHRHRPPHRRHRRARPRRPRPQGVQRADDGPAGEGAAMSLQERLREEAVEAGWIAGQLYEEAAAELDRLQARVAELEVDAERLDWFDGNLFTGHWNGVVDSGSSMYWLLRGDWRHQIKDMRGNTFRAAIDTARKAKP